MAGTNAVGAMERSILIKAKAGLGNRMLATMTGMLFGKLCGRRIIVDWCDGTYAEDGVNAFSLLFDAPVLDVTTCRFEDVRAVAPAIWAGHLDWTVSNMIGAYSPRRFRDPTVYRKYCCDHLRRRIISISVW